MLQLWQYRSFYPKLPDLHSNRKRKHIPTEIQKGVGKNSASTKGKKGKQGKQQDTCQDPKGGYKRGRDVATNLIRTSTSKATSSTQPLVDNSETCLPQELRLSPGLPQSQIQALLIEGLRSGLNTRVPWAMGTQECDQWLEGPNWVRSWMDMEASDF